MKPGFVSGKINFISDKTNGGKNGLIHEKTVYNRWW